MKSSTLFFKHVLFAPLFSLLLLFTACETTNQSGLVPGPSPDDNAAPSAAITLREGDVVRVTFPGATQLDTAQQIRRDGKIVLPTFGEVQAAGLTPADLEKQIAEKFGTQLLTKEIAVTVESSQYPVFVNGAVLRPGKIEATRPITVLEAIMEAGGFDTAKANLKSVKVIRTMGSQVRTHVVDLRPAIAGQPSTPFFVRPSDIIFVPEKFTLF
ncbi:MAG TPA: polysaccharide biosynthesis/export family protein [Verrucomicrobiae bacterium]|nr:polysaccharide biosynthesis/export family protein [Verrucomicrobiae bacterium]